MIESRSFLTRFRRSLGFIFGSVMVIFGGVYFFHVSARSAPVKDVPEQPLTIGKLAASRAAVGPGPSRSLVLSNPDGTGLTVVPNTSTPFGNEPAWSPDGTRLAFASSQSPGEIFVVGADGSGLVNLTNTAEPTRETSPTWSLTGKIAYIRSFDQIWVMNADGTGQVQFPGITQPGLSAPVWSPDGTKLAFASGGEIWVINADGTNQHRVTTNATVDADPAWSPDGLQIAFGRDVGIGVINADGTNETPLTTTSGDSQPSWSTDGSKIAFKRNGIWTMDPNGGNQVQVLFNSTAFPLCCDIIYEHPAWQPVAQVPNTFSITGRVTYNNIAVPGVTVNLTGTTNAATATDAVGNYQFAGLAAGGTYTVSPSYVRRYFTPANSYSTNLSSNRFGADFVIAGVCQSGKCVKNGKIAFARSGEIYTILPDGTGMTNITNNAANDGEPSWSPDGLKLLFSSDRDGNTEIYRMNSESDPNPTRLTNNTSFDLSPSYSPDGSSIVFYSFRDGNYEIYKMNSDGSNQVRLTNNTIADTYPAFSPDGARIVFVNAGTGGADKPNLWSMNADGSDPHALGTAPGIFPGYERPSYSPDGTKIIYTYTADPQSQPRAGWVADADGSHRVQVIGGIYPTYSADGAKVSFICCQFDNSNRLRTSNSDGSGVQTFSTATAPATFSSWQSIPVTQRTPFDFDGDGKSDLSIFRGSTNDWWYLSSIHGAQLAVNWGLATDVLAPGDYDGDLKTDNAVWRPSTGDFHILNSFNYTVRTENFGLAGDIPTGGDWDGDGKTDVAVYRGGTQGVFYYRGSMGNPQGNITAVPWGIPGDKPVAGDYDGDGLTDAAIYRNGGWWVRQSSNAQLFGVGFGLADDKVVPADYDGDGKTDPAIYRNGQWYLLRSSQGFSTFPFGIAGDIPVPGDYDGDGHADAAIFRNGVWWLQQSMAGTLAVGFGFGSDTPVPAAYIR